VKTSLPALVESVSESFSVVSDLPKIERRFPIKKIAEVKRALSRSSRICSFKDQTFQRAAQHRRRPLHMSASPLPAKRLPFFAAQCSATPARSPVCLTLSPCAEACGGVCVSATAKPAQQQSPMRMQSPAEAALNPRAAEFCPPQSVMPAFAEPNEKTAKTLNVEAPEFKPAAAAPAAEGLGEGQVAALQAHVQSLMRELEVTRKRAATDAAQAAASQVRAGSLTRALPATVPKLGLPSPRPPLCAPTLQAQLAQSQGLERELAKLRSDLAQSRSEIAPMKTELAQLR
jgi:hypothetical protein